MQNYSLYISNIRVTYLPRSALFENKAYINSADYDVIHPFDLKQKTAVHTLESEDAELLLKSTLYDLSAIFLEMDEAILVGLTRFAHCF